jgi:predicted SAM-dependent methyltransferase
MNKLNLGCGNDVIPGYINIDENSTDPRVIRRNIETYLPTLEDSCVDAVKAHHVLEHVVDLDALMRHLHRVCINGSTVDIVVPLANTLWAVANPDHKRLFNHRTFQYYTEDFITSDLGLFKGFSIINQKIEREANEWFDGIEWIVANLHVWLRVNK